MFIRQISIFFFILCFLVFSYKPGQSQEDAHCLDTPQDTSCTNYLYPDGNSTHDMMMLCSMMPYMSGCSIQNACTNSHDHHGELWCEPFSLLADVCAYDMPGMSGCANYKKLCFPTDSVIEQCDDFPPIPGLPTTSYINDAIKSMCSGHFMTACSKCPTSSPGYMNCDLLAVYSELCLSMPDMIECQQWKSMCESGLTAWPEYCPSNEQPPIMRMYFHTGIVDYILFKGWVARTDLQYVGSMVAIVLMAIVYEALQSFRAYLEWRWNSVLAASNGEKLPLVGESNSINGEYTVAPFIFSVDVTRALLHTVEVALGYFLMLIAMTYNMGLFLAVLVGFFLGNLFFSRYRKYAPRSCCA